MAVDGNWNIRMETPLGERSSELTLKAEGGTLTGTQAAEGNSTAIFDGTVDGNQVAWKVKIVNPMPLTLTFSGGIDGDKIEGSVDSGSFGSWPFAGKRA